VTDINAVIYAIDVKKRFFYNFYKKTRFLTILLLEEFLFSSGEFFLSY